MAGPLTSKYTGSIMWNGFVFLALLVSVLLRWSVSLHNYSGHGKPPMFGDYEAQRHWMEITLGLQLEDWYMNTTDNDLLYWGLDYPPLTAYHSLLCGYVGSSVDANFTALHTSRGFESYEHKLFMRASVLIADFLIFIPAVMWYFGVGERTKTPNNSLNASGLSLFLTLIYPGLILIDHGHFQYNNISLGLFIAAVAALNKNCQLFGAFLFVLSLNFKQMELYHALPFFCYLLGTCLPRKNDKSLSGGFQKLIQIGMVVIGTFFIIWLPFLTNLDVFTQVLVRLFPLARGVFEDKVANVWCAINVIYKLRDAFTNVAMARICLITTFLAVLPSSIDLVYRPNLTKFRLALINCSLAFFLFSFQVHEKSILLVAFPIILYFQQDSLPSYWFLLLSVFSMLPLLQRDGLLIPTLALIMFYSVSVRLTVDFTTKQPRYVDFFFYTSMTGCVILAVSLAFITPPIRYPDLFPLLISVYSCVHFCAFFVYFNLQQIILSRFEEKLKSH